jgi:hypothetical protein
MVVMFLLLLALSSAGLGRMLVISLIGGAWMAGFGALSWKPQVGSDPDSVPKRSE